MPILTSENSPLRIPALRVPGTDGFIGLTICPGKQGPSASSHVWARNLDQDIRTIRAWGASQVVTLLEPHEFEQLGVEDLGARLESAGLAWFHLQIADGAPPDSRFEEKWRSTCERVVGALSRGGRVLVHCRGGLGRSGLVAAIVLREFGVSGDEAIDMVRATRPGAIETSDQEKYVYLYRPFTAG